MGIKLKWFRHRLTFDQIPTDSSSSSSFSGPSSTSTLGRFRRSKSEAVIVTSYYRRSLDEENVDYGGPRELPPIKARKRSQQSITALLPSAPSLPNLRETSSVEQQQFMKVEKPKELIRRQNKESEITKIVEVEEVSSPVQFRKVHQSPPEPTPVKQKVAPVPPIPPKRKEVRSKEVIYNEPPPSYTEEDTIKQAVIDNNNNINKTNNGNTPAPTIRAPERKKKLPSEEPAAISTPPSIEANENQFNGNDNEAYLDDSINHHSLKDDNNNQSALFRSMQKDTPTSPKVNKPRPHTVPAINDQADVNHTSSLQIDTPPPLPTSAPPLEDPKPWFEIEEEIIDQTANNTPRTSYKKTNAPAPPARTSNPTDELPVLIATPSPRLTPTNESKFPYTSNGHSTLPASIKIGETTPPAVQKHSKIRAFFGISSPVSSPEPPKPKARRIRVPKQKSPKNSPKPMPRTISLTSEDLKPKVVDFTPASPKQDKQEKVQVSYDTPLTILPGKSSSPVALPEPPVRKTKQKEVQSKDPQKPKQLSFAETATVFSEDDDELGELNEMSNERSEDDGDSWDLVARHRANINQNASQVKAAATRPKNTNKGTEKRVDFVPLDRPRTMREMRKSQSTGAGVNLKNKNGLLDESDTEA